MLNLQLQVMISTAVEFVYLSRWVSDTAHSGMIVHGDGDNFDLDVFCQWSARAVVKIDFLLAKVSTSGVDNLLGTTSFGAVWACANNLA